MPHSWKAYEKAKEIADCLAEAGLITRSEKEKVWGIIQIKLEEAF